MDDVAVAVLSVSRSRLGHGKASASEVDVAASVAIHAIKLARNPRARHLFPYIERRLAELQALSEDYEPVSRWMRLDDDESDVDPNERPSCIALYSTTDP